MDDEQQPWWTNPPRPPAPEGPAEKPEPGTRPSGRQPFSAAQRPAARTAGPPDDPIELIRDDEQPRTGATATPRSAAIQLPPTAPPRSDGDPPTRPVEYLTVRLDPDPGPQRSGDTMDVPAAAMPRMRQAQPDRPASHTGIRRGPAIAIGVGVLLVVVLVAVIASKVGLGVDPRSPSNAAIAASPPTTQFPGAPPQSLAQVPAGRADTLLRKARQPTTGTVRQAFTWTDDNGMNLLVASSLRTSSGTTLRVVHVAGLDKTPRTLRVMTDPDLPLCSGSGGGSGSGGRAEFTVGSMFVRDLNRDGVAEATIGWSSRCPGSSRSEAKLAMISGTNKYIIRGQGEIGHAGSGTGRPDPVPGRWPPAYLKPLTTLYSTLYF